MIGNKNIKIIVATHKSYWMPSDEMYLPLQVGAEGKTDDEGNALELGYTKDNTGDNISAKNKNYCELTGLYWAWKNLKADYIGLVHYRRHFVLRKGKEKSTLPITSEELLPILEKNDVILPKMRNYFIETNYSQYIHAHHKEDLDITRVILKEKYPEYIKAYDSSMKKTSGHRFNMFIMKRKYFDSYCQWLFNILFELELRLDISNYNDYDSRVFGFVSERLLDVWIGTNNIIYKELPVLFMEKENWLIKSFNFLKRKIRGTKKQDRKA